MTTYTLQHAAQNLEALIKETKDTEAPILIVGENNNAVLLARTIGDALSPTK